jgi:hypothetical protein
MRNENTALRQQLHHTRQLNMEERVDHYIKAEPVVIGRNRAALLDN